MASFVEAISCLGIAASSPTPSVGVCSDQCRKAATIGSVPTDDEGDFNKLPRVALEPEPEGGVTSSLAQAVLEISIHEEKGLS